MTIEEYNKLWDEYLYPGTEVLKNNLGIIDQEKLKEKEATITFEKLLELATNQSNFRLDQGHLKYIHQYIFGEIYPFAGKYRTINMRKQRGWFYFIDNDHNIESYLNQIFAEVNEKLKRCYSKYDFCEVLAYLYTNLIYCHPFREGNGRTIREFVREASIAKSRELGTNLELDWRLIDKEELNAKIEVAHMYPGETAILFMDALVPIENLKEK